MCTAEKARMQFKARNCEFREAGGKEEPGLGDKIKRTVMNRGKDAYKR